MSSPTELAERMARMEIKLENLLEAFHAERRAAEKAREEVIEAQRRVEKEMTHYKGILGGVALVFSGIGVVFMLFKGWLLAKLGINV